MAEQTLRHGIEAGNSSPSSPYNERRLIGRAFWIKTLSVCISLLSFFVGGLIYLLFRTETLEMFGWARTLGIYDKLSLWRRCVSADGIPEFVIFALPDGLWLFSYIVVIATVWDFRLRQCWLSIIALPVVALVSEMGQISGIVPGTFDMADMGCYLLATILGMVYSATAGIIIHKGTKRTATSDHWFL